MGYEITQNQTAQPLEFLLVLSSDGITGATGKSPTVTLSKNGGAFAAPAGAVTEMANGWYKVAGNATDANTLGPLILHATEASSNPADDVFPVIAVNKQDGVRMGLTALPNAAANAAGGLPISAAGALDMDDLAADVDATETRVALALPNAAPQAAGGLITSAAGAYDADDLAADVDAIETRVTLALPAAAPQAAGGLVTSIAGSLDLDEMNADIELIQTSAAATPTVVQIRQEMDTNSLLFAYIGGLVGHNAGVRNQQYDGSGNLTSADICSYDTPAHATTNDGVTGLVHKWALAQVFTNGRQTGQSISFVS